MDPKDIDIESITDGELQRWKKLRWVWCNDCGGGAICKAGWAHKTRTGHDVVSLKTAKKSDEALREFLWESRGGKAARQELVKQKQVSEAGKARSSSEALQPYKLDFGKHKGRGLAELFNSEDGRRSDYIPWLFASSSKQGLSSQLQVWRCRQQKA
jgi:hypothetical protein